MNNTLYENVNMINCGNTNCYVIRGDGGDILIDTGTERYRSEIEMWLLNYNIKMIILTHGHNDHIGNAAYFSSLFGAGIYMSKADYSLTKDNMSRKIYKSGLMGRVVAKMSEGIMEQKAEPFYVTMFIDDGDTIGADIGAPVYIIGLGGHTKGSVGVVNGDDLYCGDAVINMGRLTFPAICESPKASRQSIDMIGRLRPRRIFFGHGEPIETKDNKEYRDLFSKYVIM